MSISTFQLVLETPLVGVMAVAVLFGQTELSIHASPVSGSDYLPVPPTSRDLHMRGALTLPPRGHRLLAKEGAVVNLER